MLYNNPRGQSNASAKVYTVLLHALDAYAGWVPASEAALLGSFPQIRSGHAGMARLPRARKTFTSRALNLYKDLISDPVEPLTRRLWRLMCFIVLHLACLPPRQARALQFIST